MSEHSALPFVILDARTFQKQLGSLATTIGNKVSREGPQQLRDPAFVTVDLYMMLRQASQIHDLFFYLNADERRLTDPNWKVAYIAAPLPLIRTMIDCLYNITAILENPKVKGRQFRDSGYRQLLEGIEADEKRYGGNSDWDAHLEHFRGQIELDIRRNGITIDEVKAAKIWPTLSSYLRPEKNTPLTPHQEFLKTVTFRFWHEFSGMSHAMFQGLMPTAMFYVPDEIPHEERARFEDYADRSRSMHVGRVAGILLCILTELQAYFRFDGANINRRLHEVWNALLPVFEIRELYDERYAKLMKDRRIEPE